MSVTFKPLPNELLQRAGTVDGRGGGSVCASRPVRESGGAELLKGLVYMFGS